MKTLLSITTLILFAFLYACNRNPSPISSTNAKDKVLDSFFHMIDTLPYYDTNSTDFKFIKAYRSNDTLALTSLIKYLQFGSVKPWMNRYLKSCAKNQEFDTLRANEAYRFVYESSFCEYFTIATIIKNDNKITASVVVYKNASLMDSIPCTIAQQNEISIEGASWEKFKDAIVTSDFWGLKEDNDYHGVDGNSLDVFGYQKDYKTMKGTSERRSYVSRWGSSLDRLTEPFMMILRFCNISIGCIIPD